MLKELIEQTRTVRRFHEDEPVSEATVLELLELARLGGSARNLQPLRYAFSIEPRLNNLIFPHLGWAGYLPQWPGPGPGERPAAYVLCLLDTRIAGSAECDLGIASQNLLLGATVRGLAGCRIASIGGGLAGSLGIPEHLRIMLVICLGRPKEDVVLDVMSPSDDCRYWRDDKQRHHVPKRRLSDLIINL